MYIFVLTLINIYYTKYMIVCFATQVKLTSFVNTATPGTSLRHDIKTTFISFLNVF